jgi:hypothetical protein
MTIKQQKEIEELYKGNLVSAAGYVYKMSLSNIRSTWDYDDVYNICLYELFKMIEDHNIPPRFYTKVMIWRSWDSIRKFLGRRTIKENQKPIKTEKYYYKFWEMTKSVVYDFDKDIDYKDLLDSFYKFAKTYSKIQYDMIIDYFINMMPNIDIARKYDYTPQYVSACRKTMIDRFKQHFI